MTLISNYAHDTFLLAMMKSQNLGMPIFLPEMDIDRHLYSNGTPALSWPSLSRLCSDLFLERGERKGEREKRMSFELKKNIELKQHSPSSTHFCHPNTSLFKLANIHISLNVRFTFRKQNKNKQYKPCIWVLSFFSVLRKLAWRSASVYTTLPNRFRTLVIYRAMVAGTMWGLWS